MNKYHVVFMPKGRGGNIVFEKINHKLVLDCEWLPSQPPQLAIFYWQIKAWTIPNDEKLQFEEKKEIKEQVDMVLGKMNLSWDWP